MKYLDWHRTVQNRIRVISNLQSVFLSLYALQMQAASYTRPFIFRQRTAAKTIAEQILLEKAPLYSLVLQLGHNCWKPLLFRVGRFLCNHLTAAHFLESWGKLRNGLNPAFQSWNFCCNYWVHFQSGFILTWSPALIIVAISPPKEHFGQICISHKKVTTVHILVF